MSPWVRQGEEYGMGERLVWEVTVLVALAVSQLGCFVQIDGEQQMDGALRDGLTVGNV